MRSRGARRPQFSHMLQESKRHQRSKSSTSRRRFAGGNPVVFSTASPAGVRFEGWPMRRRARALSARTCSRYFFFVAADAGAAAVCRDARAPLHKMGSSCLSSRRRLPRPAARLGAGPCSCASKYSTVSGGRRSSKARARAATDKRRSLPRTCKSVCFCTHVLRTSVRHAEKEHRDLVEWPLACQLPPRTVAIDLQVDRTGSVCFGPSPELGLHVLQEQRRSARRSCPRTPWAWPVLLGSSHGSPPAPAPRPGVGTRGSKPTAGALFVHAIVAGHRRWPNDLDHRRPQAATQLDQKCLRNGPWLFCNFWLAADSSTAAHLPSRRTCKKCTSLRCTARALRREATRRSRCARTHGGHGSDKWKTPEIDEVFTRTRARAEREHKSNLFLQSAG